MLRQLAVIISMSIQ